MRENLAREEIDKLRQPSKRSPEKRSNSLDFVLYYFIVLNFMFAKNMIRRLILNSYSTRSDISATAAR